MTDEQKQQAVLEWLGQKYDALQVELADEWEFSEEADELRTVSAYLHSWLCELNGTWHLHYALDRRTERKALQKLELWKALVDGKDGAHG